MPIKNIYLPATYKLNGFVNIGKSFLDIPAKRIKYMFHAVSDVCLSVTRLVFVNLTIFYCGHLSSIAIL